VEPRKELVQALCLKKKQLKTLVRDGRPMEAAFRLGLDVANLYAGGWNQDERELITRWRNVLHRRLIEKSGARRRPCSQ